MSSEPKQVRSADSMSRMLDAGEELFQIGGGAQLKLNSIIERSNCSTGSFYARFGDMQGYLEALHERALERIEAALVPAIQSAGQQTSVFNILHVFLSELIKILRRFQATTYFFVVGSTHAPLSRPRGSEFNKAAQSALADLIRPHLNDPQNPEVERRLDVLVRLVTAMGIQQIMFEKHEISELEVTDEELAMEWAAILAEGISPFSRHGEHNSFIGKPPARNSARAFPNQENPIP